MDCIVSITTLRVDVDIPLVTVIIDTLCSSIYVNNGSDGVHPTSSPSRYKRGRNIKSEPSYAPLINTIKLSVTTSDVILCLLNKGGRGEDIVEVKLCFIARALMISSVFFMNSKSIANGELSTAPLSVVLELLQVYLPHEDSIQQSIFQNANVSPMDRILNSKVSQSQVSSALIAETRDVSFTFIKEVSRITEMMTTLRYLSLIASLTNIELALKLGLDIFTIVQNIVRNNASPPASGSLPIKNDDGCSPREESSNSYGLKSPPSRLPIDAAEEELGDREYKFCYISSSNELMIPSDPVKDASDMFWVEINWTFEGPRCIYQLLLASLPMYIKHMVMQESVSCQLRRWSTSQQEFVIVECFDISIADESVGEASHDHIQCVVKIYFTTI